MKKEWRVLDEAELRLASNGTEVDANEVHRWTLAAGGLFKTQEVFPLCTLASRTLYH
jgi:hypothetical protein